MSGGHFRATLHRVVDPPEDQIHEDRLSLVLFQASEGDLRMEPAWESPLLKREGCIDTQGAYREFKKAQEAGKPVGCFACSPLTHAYRRSLPTDNGERPRLLVSPKMGVASAR